MGMIKETFKQYKWILLAGVIVAILIALIAANLHVLQFMRYKMQHDTEGVISIMQSHIRREDESQFFTQGMDYLLGQDEYTEGIKNFFETNFESFSLDQQKQVIKAYNGKQLRLPMSQMLMGLLVDNIQDDTIRAYIKRLEVGELEQGLIYIYGDNPEVNEVLISGLHQLLNIYPGQLSFEKFKFNLYDLLNYPDTNAQEQKKSIINKLPKDVAREAIFKELKTKSITEKQICEWVKFFNDTNLISNSEYTTFNNTYSEIVLIRNQYKGLDEQQVELQNKKDQVDLQISDSMKSLEAKQADISKKQAEVSGLESQIDELTNYTHMALYIEKSSQTGSNEYIASIPRNSLFGFKPSHQKYIVKLQESSLANEGVQYLDIYFKGTKSIDGKDYAYYVQVSSSDLTNISNLENERSKKLQELESLRQEAKTLENNIATIKKDNNYDENQQALMGIASQRTELSTKLSEKVLGIKELFGLKDLNITLES